uniref:SSD domain-containing protein n=1 Tax=Heterorhabditis bacteriophora TaxID=37862 RepID=A0A1I7XG82_HETBA
MYSLEVFRQLCAVDDVIRIVINTTNYQAATTQFKHSFNLPYYSTCLNFTTPNNCASLNENDISFFQTIIEKCQAGSKDVACQNEMIEQVLHYLTPNQPEKAPAVIAIILPVKINSWRIGDPYNPLYRESDRVAHALRCSLSHSLVSMFVTSITTAVAFLSNLSSEIIVLRCFGIFASITVVINYVLVILLLPSTIILTCASNSANTMFSYELSKFVTQWVYRLRFAIVLGGLFLTVAATFIIFFSPGLSMPHYNPTKLLVNTQPHEWFDNNAHFFNFEWKRKIKIMENYMIGLPTLCLSSSEVTKYYDIITHLYKSTFYSILISIVVSLTVVVLYTRQFFLSVLSVVVISAVILWTTASLILVGWELSVIESTILVLTIGLSFDYTLHYAVAFRGTLSLPMQDRIK